MDIKFYENIIDVCEYLLDEIQLKEKNGIGLHGGDFAIITKIREIKDFIKNTRQSEIVKSFIEKISKQENLPDDYQRIVNKEFWELI